MSRSLDDLAPKFRAKADVFLEEAKRVGLDLLVTCTSRTMDEQGRLYAQGRTAPGHIVTNAKPGDSAHNFGLAMDVVPIVNGKPDWAFNSAHPSAAWAAVGSCAKFAGLEWFGDPAAKFSEACHVQLPGWRAFT